MAKKKKTANGGTAPGIDLKAHAVKKSVVVEGNDLPTYYANSAHIDLSSWDVRFRFGQIQGAQDGTLQIKETSIVYMSHSHAKAFLEALKSSVAKLDHIQPVFLKPDEKAH
jgi:hypothetical protein